MKTPSFHLLWLLALSGISACSHQSTRTNEEPVFPDQKSTAIHFIQPLFTVLDCERKGEIESGEVDEHFFELYFFTDRDRSRSISLQEYINSVAKSSSEQSTYIFNQMDTDKDALISTREFRDYLITSIEIADANQDGSVTEQEARLEEFRTPVTQP